MLILSNQTPVPWFFLQVFYLSRYRSLTAMFVTRVTFGLLALLVFSTEGKVKDRTIRAHM